MVLIEAISVVIRAEAVTNRYPGGWERFRDECPNNTLCADGELIRVGFMAPQDVKQFVEHLGGFGITYLRDGTAVDLVVVDQQRGFAAPCDWAEFGHVDWEQDCRKQVAACRAVGSKSNEVVTPPGWKYEGSLTATFQFVESGRVPEFLDFVRHENGVAVYRDLRTGKDVYIGRTGGGQP
jgi:hypothetical protein